ncbi:FimD/PapC C-terminal domain-containing protein [Citrobacter amalonaticus]|uniref:FimD/PapC C-terminal domain-containing protein n=1 Tax=Citrobacter amalonaticus TaxID=35703 RepID=UPI001CE47207|nr:FimD/PapC C-terminal domain-containing protein [Citrobacter amalonaticus]
MGSCAAPSAKGDDKFITTDYLQQCPIGYQAFGMAKGMKMMGTLRLTDGSVPPFGAEIYNTDGVSVAMVLEDGQAWLAGVNANETLNVMWGGKQQCQVTIPPGANNGSANTLLPCR